MTLVKTRSPLKDLDLSKKLSYSPKWKLLAPDHPPFLEKLKKKRKKVSPKKCPSTTSMLVTLEMSKWKPLESKDRNLQPRWRRLSFRGPLDQAHCKMGRRPPASRDTFAVHLMCKSMRFQNRKRRKRLVRGIIEENLKLKQKRVNNSEPYNKRLILSNLIILIIW